MITQIIVKSNSFIKWEALFYIISLASRVSRQRVYCFASFRLARRDVVDCSADGPLRGKYVRVFVCGYVRSRGGEEEGKRDS